MLDGLFGYWFIGATPQPIIITVKKENITLQTVRVTPDRYGNYNLQLIASETEGIYKITLKSPFKKGEYCFVLASNTRKVFDFGIE